MKQKYAPPAIEIQLFEHEHTITGSAITSTENALRSGDIKVNGKTLSDSDTLLSIRF